MKKYYYLSLLSVLLLIAGCPPAAVAQDYEVDTEVSYVTESSQLSSNCTWKPDENNDNNLPENNREFYSKGDYLGTLLDGSQSTYWHSEPNNVDLRTSETWIQVDLKTTDATMFYLMLERRGDIYNGTTRRGIFPTAISVYGTNDESLAKDMGSALKDWTKLADLANLPDALDDAYTWPYYSPRITNSEGFRYIRINPTAGSYAYWCPSELRIYGAKKETDYRKILNSVIDSVYSDQDKNGIAYTAGTEPGYVLKADYDKYNEDFSKALTVADDENATDEQLIAAIKTVRDINTDIKKKVIPVSDGYYFIRNCYADFNTYQGVEKQMFANGKALYWGTADEKDVRQYFYVKRLEDGNYTIQNAYTKDYISYALGNAFTGAGNYNLTLTDTVSAEQTLTPLFNGSWFIANDKNSIPYHTIHHNNGKGESGNVVCASVYVDASKWTFVKADYSKVGSLADSLTAALKADTLADELLPARIMDMNMRQPDSVLIKSGSQLTSNCLWSAQYDTSNLIDGDHVTHFHSDPSIDYTAHDEYLQADLLNENHTGFVIEYWGRNEPDHPSWHDNVMAFEIKATNTPDDESSWKTITTLDRSFPAEGINAHYVSGRVEAGQGYRYWRFYVRKVGSGSIYWNMSEFQLYDPVNASASSLYAKNSDAKAATDELEAALKTAEEHVAANKADGTEIVAMNNAINKLNALQKIKDKVQAEADKAQSLYNSLFTFASSGLITTVNTNDDGTNQLSANHTWTSITPDNDNYSFNAAFIEDGYNLLGALIDNDDQTYWHSDPNSNLNREENYLQIDLKRTDVSSFRIRIDRRNDFYNGTYRHGVSVSQAVVYGTNDETLANDLNSPCTSWTQLTLLSDIPLTSNDAAWPYVSSVITPSTPYRYLRYRPITCEYNYWCISGFQILEGNDNAYNKDASQYFRVEGMKDAADKLQAEISSVKAKLNENTATMADSTALAQAEAAVKALWQDESAYNSLFARADSVAENATAGDEMGEVSDATLISNLKSELASAKPMPANTDAFKAKYASIEKAYEALQEGVNGVKPGKWYYIVSATLDDDAAPEGYYGARDNVKGAALYILNNGNNNKGDMVGNYTAGEQIRWGMDDIKGVETAGDPEAIWRFVPAPDSVGKHAYYIQNMRTGWYVGNCNLDKSDFYYLNSNTPDVAFRVEFIGRQQFNLVPVNGTRAGIPIVFGDNARQVRGDILSTMYDNRASLTFTEFTTDDQNSVAAFFINNTAQIVTLPFDVDDITADQSAEVKAYAVKSINDDHTAVGVKEITSIKAGEPFFLVIGDTAQYAERHDTIQVWLGFPTVIPETLAVDTVNGLISTPIATQLKANGLGYIADNKLQAVSGLVGVTVNSLSGYLNPGLIVNEEGEPDAWIPLSGSGKLNVISKTAVKPAAVKVNVYTVDGALLKSRVDADKAAIGLKKGIYIIGGKKTVVK